MYSVPDLMSTTSGRKVTILTELKVECLWEALLSSIMNSLGNPFEAEIISLPRMVRKSSFIEAPWLPLVL